MSTDQTVVGSQRRIVKTPVVQVIVSGVEVPGGGNIVHIFILKLCRKFMTSYNYRPKVLSVDILYCIVSDWAALSH